jgi:hypothetical protein
MKDPVINPKEERYILQSGNYQLPLFSQKPNLAPPIVIEGLTKLEKLACASLLVRIEKTPKDAKGRPLKYKDLDESKRYEMGVITLPPRYSQGLYNTFYCTVGLTESEIFREKSQRHDPDIVKAANAAKEMLGTKEPMSGPQLRVFLEKSFTNTKAIAEQQMMNYNFFSQYIPKIGAKFAVEMMFNTDPKQLYLAIVSVNPPASIYQKMPKFEKAILFADIDFDSP